MSTVGWTRLIAAVVIACAFGSTGCSSDALDHDVVTANGSEPQNPLVPTNTNENGGGRIVDRLFAGLRRIDARGGLHDEVAQSIESTDQQHYTITLGPGWSFTDGTPVTSHSFVDAWNYGALVTNAQLESWAFAQIVGYDAVQASPPRAQTMSGLRVIDDRTFTVDLTAPDIDFRAKLAFTPFFPLPSVAFRDMREFGEHPIGNGPYRVAGRDAWQHEVRLDLIRNDGYHGGRPAKNAKLSFLFYQSMDTAYSDLQAGNLDLLDTIPDSALTTYRRDLGPNAMSRLTAQDEWLGIQPNVAHFAGQEGTLRRRAISMAIDRDRIASAIFHGAREPARDFTAVVLPGYNPNQPGGEVLRYNPLEAKRVWAQADAIVPWTGQFQVAYNADGPHRAWVDAVCNGLRNVLGIDAVGAPYPTFKQLRNEIVHRTVRKAFRFGWQGDYPSMLEFLEPNYVSGSATNDVLYANPEFDRLLAAAEAAPTEQESWRLISEAQALLLADLPAIPIFQFKAAAGHSDQVTNVDLAWNGLFDFENVEKPRR